MNDYDVVIVGGGISGIYLMHQLLQKKNIRVLLLESSERFGGRVHTHYEKIDGKDYVVDLGAGRLGFHHTHIMELIKKLNLENLKIDSSFNFQCTVQPFFLICIIKLI